MRRTVGGQEFELFEDAIEMRGGTAGADFADRVRVAGAQAGIPPIRPRDRAAFSPALVRSAMSALSSCATAPSTCKREHALRRDISIGS